MKKLIITVIVLMACAGCSPGRKSDYTSKTYYEKQSRVILPDKYVEAVVAVPVEDRVRPAFVVERDLYEREGKKYRQVSVRTVNLELYEAAEMRHREITATLYKFFRRLMMAGVVLTVVGILLFFAKMKFPVIPSIWDELVFFGVVAGSLGLTGSWYVDQIIILGLLTGVSAVLAVIYVLVRDGIQQTKLSRRELAVAEITDTVQTIKKVDRTAWDDAKKVLTRQSASTERLVQKYKKKLESGNTRGEYSEIPKTGRPV